MKSGKRIAVLAALAATMSACLAAETPASSKNDKRLRVVNYDDSQVVTVNIIKGVGTRIMLARDEKIKAAAPGYAADCSKPEHLWCIVANTGDSEIYVKAKSDAREPNNLEVTTDKRAYSFDFILNPGFDRERDGMFRITFKYPADEAQAKAEAEAKKVAEAKLETMNKPRNWNYTMQVMPGSDVVAPSRVFDDGRFTKLTFPANRSMPEVFVVEADGSESIPPSHVEKDTIVLHRVYKRLVLRLSKYVVGIWNEAYDPDGVPPEEGSTVKGLKRVVRSQE